MFYIYANGQQIYKPLDDLLIVFNPKLTLELGKAGSLEFDIPPNNPFYDQMNQLSTEVSVDMDDDELFHGRVLSNERMFNNVRHIYCEGDLSYLVDSVQKGVRFNGTTHELFRQIIANHNARMEESKQFTVGNIDIEDRSITLIGQSESEDINTGAIDYEQIAIDSIVDEWNNTLDYIQTCLIDYCGGYLRTRRVDGTLYIDLLDDFQNRAIQPIELGTNLLDLTEEVGAEDVFTVLIPLGDDNLTIASVNGGSDELVDTNAVARFGRIVKTHVFSNVSSATTLLENAQRFLATSINVPRTISVRAVDLHLINALVSPIRIGDRVKINSVAHDVDDELTCTRIEYDLEKPENNSYIFGNPRQSLTQRYREDARLSNDTYGNSAAMSPTGATSASAASPAKAAAAAAGAAGVAADKEKEKALQEFYDAWVDFDPDQATVSLGALSRQYYDGKEVLLSQCGIDLDGKTGNVNIQSLHNVVDDHGNLIAANEAYIKMVEDDTAVELQHVAQRHEELAGVESDHYTAITQRASSIESSIDLLARDVNEFEDNTTTALADINIRADDLESRISSNTEFINSVDAKADDIAATESRHWTSITQTSNDHESRISSVTGAVGDLDAREANHYSAIVQVSNDHADAIKIVAQRSTNNETNIASITATVTDHGSQINLKADKTYVDGQLEAVSAEFNKLITGRTVARTIIADSIRLSGGEGSTSVAVASMSHSHDFTITEQDSGVVKISIGTATNTYPQERTFNIANTKYYKDGVEAVTIKSLAAHSYSSTGDYSATIEDGYLRYNTSDGYLTGRISITFKNNTIQTAVIKMDGKRARDSVTITEVNATRNGAGDATYQSGMKRYVVPLKLSAKASNDATGSDTTNIYVSASDAYDAGKDDVTVSVSDDGVTWNSYYAMYYYGATARASNGETSSFTQYFNPTEAINFGKSQASGYTNIYYGADLVSWYQSGGDVTGVKVRIYVYGTSGGYNQLITSGDVQFNRY